MRMTQHSAPSGTTENPIAYFPAHGEGWRFVDGDDLDRITEAYAPATTEWLRTHAAMELNWGTNDLAEEMSRIGALICLTPESKPGQHAEDLLNPAETIQVGSYVRHNDHSDRGVGYVLAATRDGNGDDIAGVGWERHDHSWPLVSHLTIEPNPFGAPA